MGQLQFMKLCTAPEMFSDQGDSDFLVHRLTLLRVNVNSSASCKLCGNPISRVSLPTCHIYRLFYSIVFLIHLIHCNIEEGIALIVKDTYKHLQKVS
jgi:hypothetical protein